MIDRAGTMPRAIFVGLAHVDAVTFVREAGVATGLVIQRGSAGAAEQSGHEGCKRHGVSDRVAGDYAAGGVESRVKASSAWLAYMTEGPAPM